MRKIKWKMLATPMALASVLVYWSAAATAGSFVVVSGAGVNGQAVLDITGLTVKEGSTTVSPTTYTRIASTAASTVNGTDPSTSQVNTGPGFAATTASVTFNKSGGETYSQSSNPDASSFHTLSENSTTGPSTTATGTNTQSFYFTAATNGQIDIAYALHGHVEVDGTAAPRTGTAATADYTFGVDITRSVNGAAPTTTHVALEKGGVSIPIFGTIYSQSQDTNKANGIQFSLAGVVAGERLQLQFFETSGVTATVGASPVPEPSSLLLACVGLVGLGANRFRRRNATKVA